MNEQIIKLKRDIDRPRRKYSYSFMFGYSEINTSQQIYYCGMVARKLSDPSSVIQSQPRNALHSFPVKKYFNLFWRGTFCSQRNYPLNG